MRPRWRRMPIEAESPEEFGYGRIRANLAESSCRDRRFGELGLDLDELLLLYGDHRGHPGLRAALGAEAGLGAEDVLLTTGAAMALFLVASALLGPGEPLVVLRPNYATNLETPWALGAELQVIDLRFEDGWALDPGRVAAALRPGTRLISVTSPHNPTGTELDRASLDALLRLAEVHDCHLLVDETYREMSRQPLPVAAGLSPRAISVASLSKTYGLPGIRLGWIQCADRALQAKLLAVKEQVVLTGSVLDEAVGAAVWARRGELLPGILDHIDARRARLAAWMAGRPELGWVPPTAGVVAFPRMADGVDVERVYARLAAEGVMVGPGHWFEQDRRFFRLGYAWPGEAELELGLGVLAEALAG